jgi:hypothetical protein
MSSDRPGPPGPEPEASPRGRQPETDEQLWARQLALQGEAQDVLAELDLSSRFADVGPVLVTGSFVSGLMAWRDVDVMVLAGPEFSPRDVLRLIARLIEIPVVVGFEYRDERGVRSPTGQLRDERYHVPIMWRRGDVDWRIDLTLWLHDLHQNVTDWHEGLRERITVEQRAAVLRIKDVWHRRSSYPDQISGAEIYMAVIEDGVSGPEAFADWLTARGLPTG